jgi:hypothetical protein
MRDKIRKKWTLIIPILLYVIVLLYVFWPAIIAGPDRLISTGDVHRSHYFYLTYFKDSLMEGRIPWWNPYIYLGQPFLANPSITPWYPGTWLLLVLPLQYGFLIHFIFHVFWSMAGICVLLFPFVGVLGAGVGGLVFGLSGVVMAHVWAGNYDVIAAGSWVGWVLAGVIHLVLRPRKRMLGLTAFLIAMQLFAGYLTMAFFTWIAVGFITIITCIVKRDIRPLFWVAVAGLLGVMIASVQLLPNKEFSDRTIRTYEGAYDIRSNGAIRPELFRQLLEPFPFGGEPVGEGAGIANYENRDTGYWEQAMYVGYGAGILVLITCVVSILRQKKLSDAETILIWSMVCVVCVAAWFAMGIYAPFDLYYKIWQYVEPYRVILRIPGRHVYLIDVGIAILAGIGMGFLWKKMYRRSAIISIPICALIIVELVPYARQMVLTDIRPDKKINQDILHILKNVKPGERFDEDLSLFFNEDAPVAYRIPSVSGYDVTLLRGPYEFISAAVDMENSLTRDMLFPSILANSLLSSFLSIRYTLIDSGNVIYYLAPEYGLKQIGGDYEIYDYWWWINRNFRIYENPYTLSQWFMVPEALSFPSREALFDAVRSNTFMYTEKVGVVGFVPEAKDTPCTLPDFSGVTITQDNPEDILLTVNSPCSGYITGSHPYFPGWKVTIDGNTTNVYEGNLGFITFPIEKGNHTVRVYYTPQYIVPGLALSLVGFGIVYFLIRKHSPKKPITR